MNPERIKDALYRLGFYFVNDFAGVQGIDFYAGHIEGENGFKVCTLATISGRAELSGLYASLIKRLLWGLDKYQAESQDMIVLPSDEVRNWIAGIASQAEVTVPQLVDFVRAR